MRKFFKRFTAGVIVAAMVTSLVPTLPVIISNAEEAQWKTTELVANGDFESCTDSEISSWSVSSWLASNGLWHADLSSDKYSNNASTALKTNNDSDDISSMGISQKISVEKAGMYKVSVRSMGTANVKSGISLTISDGTNTKSVELNETDEWGKWVTSETEGISVSDGSSLTVSLNGSVPSKYYGYIDDVIISYAEEQASDEPAGFVEKDGWEWIDSGKIVNGDFETGDTSDWTITNDSFAIDNGTKNSGDYAIKTKWSDSDPVETSVTQTVKLDTGWYYLSYAQEGDSNVSGLTVSIGDISSVCEATTGWDDWKTCYLEQFYVSEEKDYTISITGSVPAGYWGSIDDIILYKYSEKQEDTTIYGAEISVDKVENLSDDFMLGTDISAVQSIYDSGASYLDEDGNKLDEAGFFRLLADHGVNWVRIRVWNNPYDANGNGYGGGNNDIKKALKMGKYATDAGMRVLIDFHYSDFWADPGKQQSPKAWKEYTIEQRANAVYEFTKDSLDSLKAGGVDVGMIQVGNETTAGAICGISQNDWENSSKIFAAGSKAARDVDENILVAVHFTNPEKQLYSSYAEKLDAYEVDYDVFASSYYPSWHGSLSNLKSELDKIGNTYGKKVIVAETSYAWTLEDGDGHENTISKGNNDSGNDMLYPFSVNGQAKWVRDVIDTVNKTTNGSGVFYWEAAWIPVHKYEESAEDAAEVLEANKQKWEQFGSGWASSYASEYDPNDAGKWYGGSAIDNQAFFDFDGKVLPSLNVYNYIKSGAAAEIVNVDYIEPVSATVIYNDNLSDNIKSALPGKVKVVMSDATSKEVDVTWSDEAISKVTGVGKYEISGEIEDSDVNALCALDIMPENLLADFNYSFENDDEGWEIVGSGCNVTKDDVYEGEKGLHYWKETADTFTAQQTITLEPGVYSLTACAEGYEGDEGILFAQVGEDEQLKSEFQLSGWASSSSKDSPNWKKPLIENITVKKNSEFTFGVTMNYQDGGWGTIDNFYLYKTDDVAADIQAKAVDELIEAVGTVTVDKEDAINTARIAYDGASEEVKKLVSKVSVLTKAEEQLKTLKTDIDNVKKLISLIDEKPTIDSKGKVQDARKAYDALPIESKAKITGYEALTLAEDIIKKLEDEKAEIDKKAAEKIAAEEALKEAEKKAEEAKKAAEKKAEETKKAAESVGAAIEDDSSKSAYVITTAPAADGSSGTVSFSGTKDISDKIITIQNIVKDAYGVQYKVTKVADNALKDNKKITDVTLGINITEIGVNAFRNCTKLSNVIIQSDSLSLVDEGAFYGDKALTAIDFSECKLKVIDKKAFSGCKELKVIKINGNKLTKVGKNAFKNIKKNAKVTIYAKNKKTYNKVVKLIKKSGAKNVKYKYVKKK